MKGGSALLELSQRQSSRTLQQKVFRGSIFDKNGILLATSLSTDSIYAEPNKLENKDATKRFLSQLKITPKHILSRRLNSAKSFVWIARRVAPKISIKIKERGFRGIGFLKEAKRFYPNHDSASQLLGLVSIDGQGLSGIEYALNSVLEGQSTSFQVQSDAFNSLLQTSLQTKQNNLQGQDVYLTIDQRIQELSERVLQQTAEAFEAKAAWAIVLERKSGNILSIANVPTFNPNAPTNAQLSARRNFALSATNEPGSVFKIITFAAALEKNVIRPNERIFCENGGYRIGKHTIKDIYPRGWLTATDVLKYSSNIGTLKIGQKVGKYDLAKMIKKFGFGEAPGLELKEEALGFVPEPKGWGMARLANISFGHGLTVSALQMALAVGAIANKGLKITPQLFSYAVDSEGKRHSLRKPEKKLRIIRANTASTLTKMMVDATGPKSTGSRAQIKGIEVAGKSGTAEKIDPINGGYSKTKNLAYFVGFAPANNPTLVAAIVIDEPTKATFGGVVAAPAWREIVEGSLIIRDEFPGLPAS